jgi:hypothetical protein
MAIPAIKTLPYQDPNNPNALLNLQYPAPQVGQVQPVGQTNTKAGGLAGTVLQQAQQQALGGFQSPLQGQLQQAAANLLQKPSTLPQNWVGSNVEQLRKQQAQGYETARQGMAPIAGAAQNQREMLGMAMTNLENETKLKTDLEAQQAAEERKGIIEAMASGREVLGQQADIWQKPIDLLLKAREASEPELQRGYEAGENAMDRGLKIALSNQDAELQTNLTNIKEAGETGRLLSSQEFESTMSSLDRAQQKAIAEGNWANALSIEQLRGELETKQQAAAQTWQTAERIASQGWQTGERVSDQDYKTTMAYLDQQNKLALQKNDLDAQAKIDDQRAKLQLTMQTADMAQEEKMVYLGNQLAEARANNDVGRQKTILTFQHGQEMEKIRVDQGFQASMQYNQQQFQTAMQANDYVQAQTMLKLQQNFQIDEAAKDRALEETRIALQKQGVDMAKVEQTYNMLRDTDPTAAFEYLQQQIGSTGIKLTAKDAAAKAKEAIDADFEAQQYQFALTHKELVGPDGLTLTPEGEMAFSQFFNENIYGDKSPNYQNIIKGIADIAELRGGADPTSENHADYQSVVSKAQEWTPQMGYDSGGLFGVDSRSINNVPAKNTVFKYNGNAYQVISDKAMQTSGENTEYFTVIDINSGETKKIYVTGNKGGSLELQGI